MGIETLINAPGGLCREYKLVNWIVKAEVASELEALILEVSSDRGFRFSMENVKVFAEISVELDSRLSYRIIEEFLRKAAVSFE